MPDREKIVEIFSELRNFANNDVHPAVSPENWCVYSKLCDLIDEAEENVLALLKEQEPMKPKVKHFELHYASYDEYENRAYCPKCGIQFIQQVNYCPKCGQAVKWE